MTLQNAIGDAEFPVRPRYRWHRKALLARRARSTGTMPWRGLLWFFGPVVVVTVGLVATQDLWLGLFPNPPEDGLGDLFFAILLFALLLGFVSQIVGSFTDVALPVREQRRYLALSGEQPITPAEQSLLGLDALSDFRAGLWNSSLSYHPTWVLMPEALRTKYDDGDKGQPFLTLTLGSLRALREDLDRSRRIIRAVDVEMFVADCFAERSWSGRLRHALQHEPEVVSRLAALTGIHELDLRDLAQPRGEHPAPLLWATDVQRVIATVRSAFGAGIVDAPTAWRLIAHAGAVAAAVFPGWAAYEDNLRTGTALGSDSLEEVNAFDKARVTFHASAWPAARIPFPLLTPGAVMPPAVLGQWPDPIPVADAE